MLESYFKRLGPVFLPSPYNGRQVYMQMIDAAKPSLPDFLEDYLDFVKCVLSDIGLKSGKVYMTVDEKIVRAGESQRKPHPHVDGHFYPELGKRSHGGGWNHYCNGIPVDRMPVIVASDTGHTSLWEGKFDVKPESDGDLSHATEELGGADCIALGSYAYALSPDCVHESPVFDEDTPRTFVRLALPVGSF